MDNFDTVCGIVERSGKHTERSAAKDLTKLVDELVAQNALEYTPGRSYQLFSEFKRTMLENFSVHSFYTWINEHKNKLIKQIAAVHLCLPMIDLCFPLCFHLFARCYPYNKAIPFLWHR